MNNELLRALFADDDAWKRVDAQPSNSGIGSLEVTAAVA